MSRCSLEIGGRKLGKLVVGEVLLRFRDWEGELCVCVRVGGGGGGGGGGGVGGRRRGVNE